MFDIVGGKIVMDADSLAIPPFKAYLDKHKDREKALKEIEYTIWLHKWNSDYLAYNPDVRASIIKQDVFGSSNYPITKDMEELAIRFNEFQLTPLTRFYKDAEISLEYVRDCLHNAKELNMDPEKVVKMLEKADKISTSLENLKTKAMAEQSNTGRVKGGGRTGHYELPRK